MLNAKLTGVVDGTDNQILFCSDGYQFTFMTNSIPAFGEIITQHTDAGIVFATTHDGRKIAIFTGGRDLNLRPTCNMKTGLYVISERSVQDSEIKCFRTISFMGGALKQLHQTWTIKNEKADKNNMHLEQRHEKTTYAFSTDEFSCDVSIGFSESWHTDKSSFNLNNDLTLSLAFDRDQAISTLPLHYRQVSRLVSFLTGQTENHIDTILLTPSLDSPEWSRKALSVHSWENDEAEIKNKTCISIGLVGEGVASLLGLFYNSQEKQPSYSLGFIPKKDEERFFVTADRVRAVCSALECEASFDDYADLPERKEAIVELCKNAKKLVKHHKKKYAKTGIISQRTYDSIYGSINFWSASAFDRFSYLYKKYEKMLMNIPILWDYSFSDEDISALIKYRNSITHGRYGIISDQVARATLVMEHLVYCCLLHRVGVPDQNIEEICKQYLGR